MCVLSFRASDASPPDPPSVIPSVHVYRRRAAMGNNALAVQDLALCTKLSDLGRSKAPCLNTSQKDLKAIFLVFNVPPCFVSTHQALFLDVDAVVEALVLPSEEGREGDDDGGQPDQQDHRPHRAEGPRVDVLHLRHRPIPRAKEKIYSGHSDLP